MVREIFLMIKIQAWVIFTRRRKGQLLIDPCLGSSAQNVLKNMCQNMCLNADKRGGQILFGQCQNKHDFPQVAPQSSLKSRPPGPILLLLAPAHTGSYTLLLGVQRIIVQHQNAKNIWEPIKMLTNFYVLVAPLCCSQGDKYILGAIPLQPVNHVCGMTFFPP